MAQSHDYKYTSIPRPSRFARLWQQNTYQGPYPSDHVLVSIEHKGLNYASWNVLGMCYYNKIGKYYNNPQNVIETFETYQARVEKIIDKIIKAKQSNDLDLIALQEATFLKKNAPHGIDQTKWTEFRDGCMQRLQDAGLRILLSNNLSSGNKGGRECAILYNGDTMKYDDTVSSQNYSVKATFTHKTTNETICFASLHAPYDKTPIIQKCQNVLQGSKATTQIIAGDFNEPINTVTTNTRFASPFHATNIAAPTEFLNNYNIFDDRDVFKDNFGNCSRKSYDGFFIQGNGEYQYTSLDAHFEQKHGLSFDTHMNIFLSSCAVAAISSILRISLEFELISETALPLVTKNSTTCLIVAASLAAAYTVYDAKQKSGEVYLVQH